MPIPWRFAWFPSLAFLQHWEFLKPLSQAKLRPYFCLKSRTYANVSAVTFYPIAMPITNDSISKGPLFNSFDSIVWVNLNPLILWQHPSNAHHGSSCKRKLQTWVKDFQTEEVELLLIVSRQTLKCLFISYKILFELYLRTWNVNFIYSFVDLFIYRKQGSVFSPNKNALFLVLFITNSHHHKESNLLVQCQWFEPQNHK